jgi:hypothetical protein
MRSSREINKGWQVYRNELLPEETSLLQQLLAHPINNEFSNPEQKPQLLDLQQQGVSSDSDATQQQQQQQQQQQSPMLSGSMQNNHTPSKASTAAPSSTSASCTTTTAAAAAAAPNPGPAYLAAPGDFLGVFRDALKQAPVANIADMTVEGWASHYRNYLYSNQDMLCVLDCLQKGEQVCGRVTDRVCVLGGGGEGCECNVCVGGVMGVCGGGGEGCEG